MTASDRDILVRWRRLGMLFGVSPSQATPDVESLIVRSTEAVPRHPRLLVLMCSWLSVFWRCVGRDRLARLSADAGSIERATLGLSLETTDSWLASPVFGSVIKRLAPLSPARPLFDADRARPALARLAEQEASPLSRRWGLWSLPVERKLDALRPVDQVLRDNPCLRTRAAYKGSLRTSLLAAAHTHGEDLTPTALARECGVTRKAIYEALEDLRFVAEGGVA